MALEFAVQLFEFLFYLFFLYTYYKSRNGGNGARVWWRYCDWIFDVRDALLTLPRVRLLDKPCAKSADVASDYAWLFPWSSCSI